MGGKKIDGSGPLSPLDQIRHMLNKSDTDSHEVIGDYEVVKALWLRLADDSGPRQRGIKARELLWWLIKKHEELAEPGSEWCLICSQVQPLVPPNAWRVLNLYKCESEKAGAFEARLTYQGLVRLVQEVAEQKKKGRAEFPSREKLASEIQIKGKPPGENWYKDQVRLAIEGLARHFQADDPLLRGALAACDLFLKPVPSQTVEAPFSTLGSSDAPAQAAAPVSPGASAASRASGSSARRVWQRRRLVLAAVTLVVLVSTLLVGRIWPAPGPKLVDLRSLDVSGYLVSSQWAVGELGPLTVLNLKTGEWRLFWPDRRSAQGEWDIPTPFYFLDPVYSPTAQLIAFGLVDGAQVHSLWVGPVIQGADGWPMLDRSHLREVLANCDGCSTFDWSPSGQWLLYDTPTGLAALSLGTLASKQLTSMPKDEWPTCSHDGHWLAYQRGQDDVVVLPSQDCLPLPNPWAAARYLGRYKPAWRLSWSPDDQTLTFTSNMSGPTLVYAAPFQQFPQHLLLDEPAIATPLSASKCSDPIWVQRMGTPKDVVLYACNDRTPADYHGLLVVRPAASDAAWQGVLDEGIMYRDGLCWIAPL